MYYTHGTGIIATKSQLSAILQFCGAGNTGWVQFRIADGELISSASNGLCACYCTGDALDGKGGKYAGGHEWEVSADLLARLARSMKGTDELILAHDKAGNLRAAIIRDIETTEAHSETSLAGHCSSQLTMGFSPPPRDLEPSSKPASVVVLAPSLTAKIAKVARACGSSSVSRWLIGAKTSDVVNVQIDEAWRIAEGHQPAWVVVITTLPLEDQDPVAKRAAELRAEREGNED